MSNVPAVTSRQFPDLVTSRTRMTITNELPFAVQQLLKDVCDGLALEFGITLSLRSRSGTILVPNTRRESWSFSCSDEAISFPVQYFIDGDQLRTLKLGHYTVSSNLEGFSHESLREAILHCFNLIS